MSTSFHSPLRSKKKKGQKAENTMCEERSHVEWGEDKSKESNEHSWSWPSVPLRTNELGNHSSQPSCLSNHQTGPTQRNDKSCGELKSLASQRRPAGTSEMAIINNTSSVDSDTWGRYSSGSSSKTSAGLCDSSLLCFHNKFSLLILTLVHSVLSIMSLNSLTSGLALVGSLPAFTEVQMEIEGATR